MFLAPDQVEKLHDFEEECMEEHARQKEYERNRSNDERLYRTAERTEMLLVRMNDLITKESTLKKEVHSLEERVEGIEERQMEVLDYLKHMNSVLPHILNALNRTSSSEINIPVEPTSSSYKKTTESRQLFVDESSRRTSSFSLHPTGSVRRRSHHGEYTSITDNIDTEGVLETTAMRINQYRSTQDYDKEDFDEVDSEIESEIEESPALNKKHYKRFKISPVVSFEDDYGDKPGPSYRNYNVD